MLLQGGEQGRVIIGAVSPGRQEHRETIRIEAKPLDAEFAAFREAERFEESPGAHEVASHARFLLWDAALHRVVARGRRA